MTTETFTFDDGLTVKRLGYGAMRLCGEGVWGDPHDLAEARRVLHRALDLGVNFIDTSDAYGPHTNEQLIGDTLAPYPDGLVIATKGGLERPGPGKWEPNGRPEHLRQALEGSLKRLKLDRIDLYQFHRPDPDVSFEESLGTLIDMREQGKIRHLGLSNVSVTQLDTARKMTPIATVQNRFNLTDRSSEDVLDACTKYNIGFMPWFPLATGDLARPGSALAEIAERLDAEPSQVALAWLLQRSPIMLPIPGTSSVQHLEENMAAASLTLSEDDMQHLNALQG